MQSVSPTWQASTVWILMYQPSNITFSNCNLPKMRTSTPLTTTCTTTHIDRFPNKNHHLIHINSKRTLCNTKRHTVTSDVGDAGALHDCPTTSAAARSRLWEEYRNRSAKNINNKDSPSKQHTNDRLPPFTPRSSPNDHTHNASNHCHMANRRSQEDIIPYNHPKSPHTRRMTMRNKKENTQGVAFAVRHRANMTTTKANRNTPRLDKTKTPRKLTSSNLHCRLADRQRCHCPHDPLH
jgi:hypothetical protein